MQDFLCEPFKKLDDNKKIQQTTERLTQPIFYWKNSERIILIGQTSQFLRCEIIERALTERQMVVSFFSKQARISSLLFVHTFKSQCRNILS